MENDTDQLLTISQLCSFLSVKKSWIYRATMQKGPGAIPRVRLGKYLRFSRAEVLKWIRDIQENN